jgi:hypothetical protein
VGETLPPLEVDVTPRVVIMGASSSRDWQPQHHDHTWAVEKVGTKDIFLNTPNIAGWIERYLTDWTGPQGRLARLSFRMRRSICAGDRMTLGGAVGEVTQDDHARFAHVAVTITANDQMAVECQATIALPLEGAADGPWSLTGDRWNP